MDTTKLLFNEQAELNNWTRTIIQTYFSWYTVFITVNILVMGWLFEKEESHVKALQGVYFVFVFLNLLAVIAAVLVRRYFVNASDRLNSLANTLNEESNEISKNLVPRSAVDNGLMTNSVTLTALSFLGFIAIWIVLAVTVKPTTLPTHSGISSEVLRH